MNPLRAFYSLLSTTAVAAAIISLFALSHAHACDGGEGDDGKGELMSTAEQVLERQNIRN